MQLLGYWVEKNYFYRCHYILVKSEFCIQYSATPIIPVFQIQKPFLVLSILDISMAFDPLKRFSSSSWLFSTLLFYLPSDSFSHLYHFHCTLSSYILVLYIGTQRWVLPSLFPLSSLIFLQLYYYLLPLRRWGLGSTLLLGHHHYYHMLLPLPKWVSPYTKFHLFLRFYSFEKPFLMALNTSPMCYKASSACLYNNPYIIALIYCSRSQTGSPRPVVSLSPGNWLDVHILRLQSTWTESETLEHGSGICFNKPSKGILIEANVWESPVCCSCLAFGLFPF